MMSEWISVEDDLPKKSKHYLIAHIDRCNGKIKVQEAWFDTGDNTFYQGDTVTHWQHKPLPPPIENSSCPMDMHEWEWKNGCGSMCHDVFESDDVKRCWIQYFMELAEEK